MPSRVKVWAVASIGDDARPAAIARVVREVKIVDVRQKVAHSGDTVSSRATRARSAAA